MEAYNRIVESHHPLQPREALVWGLRWAGRREAAGVGADSAGRARQPRHLPALAQAETAQAAAEWRPNTLWETTFNI